MKHSVYILDKDYQFMDSIEKRFKLENNLFVGGASADAGAAYSEIMGLNPQYLVFGYPMNFKAEQLVQAMKGVNPDMVLIGVLDKDREGFQAELQNAGVTHIFQKPVDNEEIINVITNDIKKKENPYQNPFAQASPTNPFSQSSEPQKPVNPFEPVNPQTQYQQPQTQYQQPQVQSQPQYQNPMQPQFNPAPQQQFNAPEQQFNAPEQQIYHDNNQSFKTIKQNLVAIHCPKGGVGKTSVSINTAALLSTAKIGKQPLKVLLVDMDWEFGDVCVNLGLKPNVNVMKWVNEINSRKQRNQSLNFTESQINNFMIKYKTGLHILAAPANHNEVLNIPGDAAEIIIRNLKENCNYDVIIFDCGNNTESYTINALLAAHSVYEVITMDVSAMNDLSMLLSTLKSISFPMEKVKLIMNRVPKLKGEGDFSAEDISEALGGLPVAVKIPDYEKVRTHNNKGEPLVLSKNTNPFTEAIMRTSNEIMGNNLFSPKKKSRSANSQNESKGFFGRLLGR